MPVSASFEKLGLFVCFVQNVIFRVSCVGDLDLLLNCIVNLQYCNYTLLLNSSLPRDAHTALQNAGFTSLMMQLGIFSIFLFVCL